MKIRVWSIEGSAEEIKALKKLEKSGGLMNTLSKMLFGEYEDEDFDEGNDDDGD